MVYPNDQNPKNLNCSFLSATIRPRSSLREKSRASGPRAGGIVRVFPLGVCLCAKCFWPRETISPVIFLKKCGYPAFFVDAM